MFNTNLVDHGTWGIDNTEKWFQSGEKLTLLLFFSLFISKYVLYKKEENVKRTNCFDSADEGGWLPYDCLTVMNMHACDWLCKDLIDSIHLIYGM